MKTFYLTFGVGSILKGVCVKVEAAIRNDAHEAGRKYAAGSFCNAYEWTKDEAEAKAKKNGLVIVDGGEV